MPVTKPNEQLTIKVFPQPTNGKLLSELLREILLQQAQQTSNKPLDLTQ